MVLRDYQTQAADAVLREFETCASTLVCLPTGAGKTVTAAEVIRRTISNAPNGAITSVIFIAHREELLTQARKCIEKHCGVECEMELAGARASEMYPAPVLLASVQTMCSGRNGARRMHKFSPYNYGLVIVDESHHAPATSYKAVLDYFRSNADLKVLGITATPERADEEALGQVFESVAFDYSVLQAIKDGWLVSIQQQLIEIHDLDFSHIRTTAGDLNTGDLAAVMEEERNLYGICDATMKELGQRKAIMFTVTVKQAEAAANILNRYRSGVAAFASGKTPPEDRRRIMRDFAEGKFQILVNCNLVSEGFDVPDADLLIQARPTKSKLLYQQQLGRIMRPLPGTVDGLATPAGRQAAISSSAKPVATVIDFVGNAGRHKLVHAIDCLGGNISDKARELAERELRKSGMPAKVEDIVIEAERREREQRERAEAARRVRLTGRATYTSRMINPFDAFDIVAPPDRAWDRGKSLSTKQRELLAKQGIDPERMSYAEGKTVLNALFDRWSKGLCSLRQAALLKRFGYESNVTRDKASEIITALKQNNWRKV
jgi:superfamily II DNA or RNA helicase